MRDRVLYNGWIVSADNSIIKVNDKEKTGYKKPEPEVVNKSKYVPTPVQR